MSNTKVLVKVCLLLFILVTSVNCASMNKKLKSWFGGSDDKKVTSNGPQPTSFSNQPNVATGKDRKYHRVTKDNFAEDQGLEEENGSLWRKEGQGSYLFSQNNLRMMGDIINVDVEGKAADNLSAKLSIIKQNLARVENPKNAKPKTDRTPAAADAGGAAPAAAPETTAANETKDADKKFDSVPCRITERNPDGSYRVKGQSPVYVGRHEYRLIVTGLVRPEDVSSDLVASSKLIEGKFDLVASNKDGHL